MGKRLLIILKNIAVIIAIPIALLQIWNWIKLPFDSLKMELRYGDFLVPTAVNDEFERLLVLLEPEIIARQIDVYRISGDSLAEPEKRLADRILRAISSQYSSEIRESQHKPFRYINGYWSAKVVNNGSQALSNVVLTIPRTIYVSIKREGQDAVFKESKDIIEIGSMRPSEIISVDAWTNSSIYSADDVRITHDRGIGDKTVYVPVGKIGQFADEYWWLALYIIGAIIIWSMIIFVVHLFTKAKNADEETKYEGQDSPLKNE